MGKKWLSDEARFWEKVDKSADCWAWLASTNEDGYGRFTLAERQRGAHRVAYEWLVGPVPKGLVIDHLCKNRACVNPAHMQPVTNRENVLRGVSANAINAAKTHCIRGHEFTPENTYRPPKYPTIRQCRECRRLRDAARAKR